MKYARFANKLLINNWKSIVLFEIFYKFLMIAGFTPLLRSILNFIMDQAGIHYIGNDNLAAFLLNPLVILSLFGLLLMVLYITFFDMIAIIQALDASYHNRQITFGQMLRKAFTKSIGIFHYRNWKFLIYIILILPATVSSASEAMSRLLSFRASSLTTQRKAPSFRSALSQQP